MFEAGPATLIKDVFNPAKTKHAILFLKGGNATEDDSLQISIKDADDSLDKTEVGMPLILTLIMAKQFLKLQQSTYNGKITII